MSVSSFFRFPVPESLETELNEAHGVSEGTNDREVSEDREMKEFNGDSVRKVNGDSGREVNEDREMKEFKGDSGRQLIEDSGRQLINNERDDLNGINQGTGSESRSKSVSTFLPASSPDADYFTLRSSPGSKSNTTNGDATWRKPLFPAQTSGSISSLGSEATLSSSNSFTDPLSSFSCETLVEVPMETTRSRGLKTNVVPSASPMSRNFDVNSESVVESPVKIPAEKIPAEKIPAEKIPAVNGDLPKADSPKADSLKPEFVLKPESTKIPTRPSVLPLHEETVSPRKYIESQSALSRVPAPIPTLRKQHTLPCSFKEPMKDWFAGNVCGNFNSGNSNHGTSGNGNFGSGNSYPGISTPGNSPNLLNLSPRIKPVKKENYKDSISKLSSTISFIPPQKVAELLHNSQVRPETNLRDVLVLDIRSFADYVKCHVSGAINICLPSTLLKRATFNLSRCVVSLPTYEKSILHNYFHFNSQNYKTGRLVKSGNVPLGAHGLPSIVIYDTSHTSANVFHICRKLVDFSCYESVSAPPIYVVDCSFDKLKCSSTVATSSGSSDLLDLNTLPVPPEETSFGVQKLSEPQPSPVMWTRSSSLDISSSGKDPIRTPIISNFSLPKNLPQSQFKIRHNEEKFDFSVVSEEELGVPLTSPEARLLPQWLRDSVANTQQIRQNFQRLEECEKLRLNSALKLSAQKDFHTPGGSTDFTPIINSGLDYGHKNRYKDIFLYEHSRVSLSDRNGLKTGAPQQDCDYINASYLRPCMQNEAISRFLQINSERASQLNYLATQGPMQRTAGDFWRCIHNQKCAVVISLTGEMDNGVEKCYAFWNSGDYYSGTQRLRVNLLDSKVHKNVVVRRFVVETDGESHHVTQLHLSTWQDMTSDVDLDEILLMVKMKREILQSVPRLPAYPCAIHCSAGCGRTGVFVAADTLINTLSTDLHRLSTDPIYEIVNNLRKQRISMVQTLRQYSMIYNLLRECIKRDEPDSELFKETCSISK